MDKKQLLYGDIARVKRSIKHWKDDIVKPLKDGDTIVGPDYDLCWVKTGCDVTIGAESCDLCEEYNMSPDFDCKNCPYLKHHGYKCFTSNMECDAITEIIDDEEVTVEGHYFIFTNNPTLENALSMIEALKAIIK